MKWRQGGPVPVIPAQAGTQGLPGVYRGSSRWLSTGCMSWGRGNRPFVPTAGGGPVTVIPAEAGIRGRTTCVQPELIEGRFDWHATNGANEPSDNRTTLG